MNERETKRTIEILLCEDNPGDVYIIRSSLRDSSIPHLLYQVSDGEEALDYLHQQGPYLGVSHPDLFLLDLNLPKKNGLEVLEEMQLHSRLRMIPTVILTSSSSEKDILKSYQLCANCYVTKPFNINEFFQSVKTLEKFWLQLAQLPPNHYTSCA